MLIRARTIANMLGVDTATVYNYVKKGLLPEHVKKIKSDKARFLVKYWDEDAVKASFQKIDEYKKMVAEVPRNKKNLGKKKPKHGDFDLAMRLMGGGR